VVADDDRVPVDQLGVHPARAVDRPGRVVDGGDLVGQPRVPDRPGRGGAVAPPVAAGGGHAEHPAGAPHADAVIDELRDEAEPVFLGHHGLDRGGGLRQDLDLLLQLSDPLVGLAQLGRLPARLTVLQATVDQAP
jgi:hypothetical protein